MNGTDTVVHAWAEACRALGIPLAPPAPLLRPDASVLLTNAGITPFKPAMLAGQRLAPTAVVQPCLRTHWTEKGRFAFDMLTMVGMAEHAGLAARLCANFTDRLGLARDRLGCVLDRGDGDLTELASVLCAPEAVEAQAGNDARYWTRWRFGEGEALVGRGLTLFHLGDVRRLSLGNLILVDRLGSGQRYVDLGFGVERLASIPHGGDEWEPTRAAQAIARLVAWGMDRDEACSLANYATAMARMIEAGARPHAHGTGYILRKLIRSAVDVALRRSSSETMDELEVQRWMDELSILIEDQEQLFLIRAEAIGHVRQVARGMRALLRRARRTGRPAAELDPAGTYGLPDWASARLVDGSA